MKQIILLSILMISVGMVSTGYSAGAPESNIKNVYKMIVTQADANKDGKLSVSECMAIYKDKKKAEKNCTYWDDDKDGFISEDEYMKQADSLKNKKNR
jgi:hypothetical protein